MNDMNWTPQETRIPSSRLQKKKKSRKPWLFGLLGAAVLGTGLYCFMALQAQPEAPAAPIVAGDLFPGLGDAESGHLSGMSQQSIMEQMQMAADASYFSFKINTRMVFETGNGNTKMGIENPNHNVYPMVVRIFLGEDGAGDMIYDSGGILPNQHIDQAKLSHALPRGDYKAMAYLYAYDPDTLENIFRSAAELDIIVEA